MSYWLRVAVLQRAERLRECDQGTTRGLCAADVVPGKVWGHGGNAELGGADLQFERVVSTAPGLCERETTLSKTPLPLPPFASVKLGSLGGKIFTERITELFFLTPVTTKTSLEINQQQERIHTNETL